MKALLFLFIFGILTSLILGGVSNKFEGNLEKRESELKSSYAPNPTQPPGFFGWLISKVFTLKFFKSLF